MVNQLYEINKLKDNDFSLILSGGSALGFAHLGVLKFLEENKIVPEEIVGVSMGAIIGSLYAFGFTYDNIYTILEDLNFTKLLKFNRKGIIFNVDFAYDLLDKIFGDRTFKDAKINLKIVATNTKDATPTLFDKNNNVKIVDALRASCAIPGIFDPVRINDVFYIDGFVASDLPIQFSKNSKKLAICLTNKNSLYTVENKVGVFSYLKNHIKHLKNLINYMMINQNNLILEIEKHKNKEKGEDDFFNNLFLIEPNLSIFRRSDFKKWREIELIGYKEIFKKFK